MKILHLSDLHLTNGGVKIWDVDVLGNFNKALSLASDIKDIDAIFITGDLSNDGSAWSYRYADDKFASLGIPTYACMGNHDSKDNWNFGYIKTVDTINLRSWKFVLLDSVVADEDEPKKNKSRGYLNKQILMRFEKDINCEESVCVLLHHPPVIFGDSWLDKKVLDNREELLRVIRRHPNVKLVLYGHIHYSSSMWQNGVLYGSAPSVGFGFGRYLPKFQIDAGTEGFNVISIGETVDIKTVLI